MLGAKSKGGATGDFPNDRTQQATVYMLQTLRHLYAGLIELIVGALIALDLFPV